MICLGCGQEVPNTYKFCPYCGYKFVNKKAENKTEKTSKDEIMTGKGIAIVCYFSFLVIIPYLFYRDNKFVRFHINQGFSVLLCSIISGVLSIMTSDLLIYNTILTIILALFIAYLMFVGIKNVCNNEEKPLPFIGNIKLLKIIETFNYKLKHKNESNNKEVAINYGNISEIGERKKELNNEELHNAEVFRDKTVETDIMNSTADIRKDVEYTTEIKNENIKSNEQENKENIRQKLINEFNVSDALTNKEKEDKKRIQESKKQSSISKIAESKKEEKSETKIADNMVQKKVEQKPANTGKKSFDLEAMRKKAQEHIKTTKV